MCFLDLFYDSAFLFNDKSCYFPSAHSFWTTGWSGPNLWRLTMVCEQIRQCRVLYSLMGFIIDLFINIFHGSKYGRYFRKSRYKEHFFFFWLLFPIELHMTVLDGNIGIYSSGKYDYISLLCSLGLQLFEYLVQ